MAIIYAGVARTVWQKDKLDYKKSSARARFSPRGPSSVCCCRPGKYRGLLARSSSWTSRQHWTHECIVAERLTGEKFASSYFSTVGFLKSGFTCGLTSGGSTSGVGSIDNAAAGADGNAGAGAEAGTKLGGGPEYALGGGGRPAPDGGGRPMPGGSMPIPGGGPPIPSGGGNGGMPLMLGGGNGGICPGTNGGMPIPGGPGKPGGGILCEHEHLVNGRKRKLHTPACPWAGTAARWAGPSRTAACPA
jgi:hypothetical protein